MPNQCRHAKTKATRVLYRDDGAWVDMRCVKCGKRVELLPSRFSEKAMRKYYGDAEVDRAMRIHA